MRYLTIAQQRQAFINSALHAREEVNRVGRVYPAAAVHKWLLARAAGDKIAAPAACVFLIGSEDTLETPTHGRSPAGGRVRD